MSAIVWKHIQTKINAVVKGKTHAFRRPGQSKPPLVSFSLRGEPNTTKDSPVQDMVICEIKYTDIDRSDVVTNAEAIRTALDFYSGTKDGTTITQCVCTQWEVLEIEEIERSKVIFEANYTYEIRLQL